MTDSETMQRVRFMRVAAYEAKGGTKKVRASLIIKVPAEYDCLDAVLDVKEINGRPSLELTPFPEKHKIMGHSMTEVLLSEPLTETEVVNLDMAAQHAEMLKAEAKAEEDRQARNPGEPLVNAIMQDKQKAPSLKDHLSRSTTLMTPKAQVDE